MGGGIGANPAMKESPHFRAFWTCLKCDTTEGKFEDNPEEPERCSECGYHTFSPHWHVFIAR